MQDRQAKGDNCAGRSPLEAIGPEQPLPSGDVISNNGSRSPSQSTDFNKKTMISGPTDCTEERCVTAHCSDRQSQTSKKDNDDDDDDDPGDDAAADNNDDDDANDCGDDNDGDDE
ncbi:protein PFC0760c-like [Haliotis asinina]|uniref:protein PFC0760c-like n=1 Tax=Haliotis asinina TaxID=109174 RepID=UPI00353200BF